MEQISTYLPGIGLAYSAFLLSIMSPGPNVLAIMGTSMSVGRPQGLALGLGVAAGSFCWAMVTATGLSAVLANVAVALTAIKIAGGLYLLWLAYKAFRSAASTRDVSATTLTNAPITSLGFFRRGLTIQMTNPKAALAWIAIISLGIQADAPLWVAAVIVIGTTILSIVIHTLYAVLFSSAPMVRMYAQARRLIQGALGAFFVFAGVKLLTSRLQ
jgi:threonine efflux protein